MIDPKTNNAVRTLDFTSMDIVEVDYMDECPTHEAFAEMDDHLLDENGDVTDAGYDMLADMDRNGEFI